jgi:hypothetical protein
VKTNITFRWDREYVLSADDPNPGLTFRTRRDDLSRRFRATRNYLGRPLWDTTALNKGQLEFGFAAMLTTSSFDDALKKLNIADLLLALAVECKVESIRRCDFDGISAQPLPDRFAPILHLFTPPADGEGLPEPAPIQFAFAVRGEERPVMEFLFALQRRDKAGRQYQYITIDGVEVAKDGEFLDPGNPLVVASGTGIVMEFDSAKSWSSSESNEGSRRRPRGR